MKGLIEEEGYSPEAVWVTRRDESHEVSAGNANEPGQSADRWAHLRHLRHRWPLRHLWTTLGSPASISDRFGSSQGGNLSAVPSSASGSSAVNPGGTVATSKRTPPGSRK